MRPETDARKLLRAAPLGDPATLRPVQGANSDVTRLLPHRAPFLFVDRLLAYDPETPALVASLDIRADDPILAGHFPGEPLFPAALQIEAVGQASLCLWSLYCNGGRAPDMPLRVARVEDCQFFAPVLPGQNLQLRATIFYHDDMLVQVGGQVFAGDTLCSFSLIKVAVTA